MFPDDFHSRINSENVRKRKHREYYSRKKGEICEKRRSRYQVKCTDLKYRKSLISDDFHSSNYSENVRKKKIVNTIQERKMKYVRKEEDVIIRSAVKI